MCAGCNVTCPPQVLATYKYKVSLAKNEIVNGRKNGCYSDTPVVKPTVVKQQPPTQQPPKQLNRKQNQNQNQNHKGSRKDANSGVVFKAGIDQGFVVSALVLILKL